MAPFDHYGAATPQLFQRANGEPCLLVTLEDSLRAIGLRPWREIWRHRTPDPPIYRRPALVDLTGDGVADVLCATTRNRVILLDGRTGQRIWGYQSQSSNSLWTCSPLGLRLSEGQPLVMVPSSRRFSAVWARLGRPCVSWTSAVPGDGRSGNYPLQRTRLEREAALTRLLRQVEGSSVSRGELVLALRDYQSKRPPDVWCRYLRARIEIARAIELDRRKKAGEASAALKQAGRIVEELRKEFPGWVKLMVGSAQIQLLRGQAELAEKTLDRAIKRAPGLGMLYYWRATVVRQKKPTQTRRDYQEFLRLEADFLDWSEQDYIKKQIQRLPKKPGN